MANLLMPLVGRVVLSNPSTTRAIAEAKVKTDKVDARILAQQLAADFLSPAWLPDDRTRSRNWASPASRAVTAAAPIPTCRDSAASRV